MEIDKERGLCIFALFVIEKTYRGSQADAACDEPQQPQPRRYLLYCGEYGNKQLMEFSHHEVYKITRQKAPQRARRVQGPSQALVAYSGGEGTDEGAGEGNNEGAEAVEEEADSERAQDWRNLIDMLKQMEAMEPSEYKSTARRLFLTYHPDKCTEARAHYAARYFRIAREHMDLYTLGRDQGGNFSRLRSFMQEVVSEGDIDDKPAEEEPTPSEAQPHSWWQQFEDELRAPPPVHAYQVGAAGGGGGGNREGFEQPYRMSGYNALPTSAEGGAAEGGDPAAVEQKPKLPHAGLADVCWQSSQQELEVAKVLAQTFPAQSVLHSHYAAEHALKFALFTAGGLSEDQYGGTQAHDLMALFAQITSGPPDVSPQRLQRLSDAYHDTRYVSFPPSGEVVLPSAGYGVAQADEAYNTAWQLIEWARLTRPLFRPGFAGDWNRRQENADADGEAIGDGETASGVAQQEGAGGSAAAAAADARARQAEAELEKLREQLKGVRDSVDEQVARERRVFEDEKRATLDEQERVKRAELEELQEAHQTAARDYEKKIQKLQAKIQALVSVDME